MKINKSIGIGIMILLMMPIVFSTTTTTLSPIEYLQQGRILKSNMTMFYNVLGNIWLIFPYIGILFGIRLASKSDGVTAFAALFLLISTTGTDFAAPFKIHPIIYIIMVISTAALFYKAYYLEG